MTQLNKTSDAFVFIALGLIITVVGYIVMNSLMPNISDFDLYRLDTYFAQVTNATNIMMLFSLAGGLTSMYGVYILISTHLERAKGDT